MAIAMNALSITKIANYLGFKNKCILEFIYTALVQEIMVDKTTLIFYMISHFIILFSR
jgi:hypothetical protein